jgi:protein-tyrosine phosphatase
MSTAPIGKWSREQQKRLDEFSAHRTVDIHCHCLHSLDDGPPTLDAAVALCQALVADGTTTVIATPHQLGRYDKLNSAQTVRNAVTELAAALVDRDIPLEVYPGGDVRVDERLPRLLDSGEIGTTADAGRHLLLELPHELFVDPLPTIDLLRERGLQAVLTHPERHHYLYGAIPVLRGWVDHGAVLQVTAGSLMGDFGRRVQEYTWQLVLSGLVGLVATDAHDTVRRPPRMTPALEMLGHRIGRDAARRLVIDNPLCVIDGQVIPTAKAF